MKMALGRGLDALIPEKGLEVLFLDIKKIVPNPKQPRKKFKDSSLKELALSIKEQGIIQPIVVVKQNDKTYSLIAGERRWRAASLAGLEKIPAIVKKADEKNSLEISLIENVQREDLNPIEMAMAFAYLQDSYGFTQEELSEKIGKDRATIANYMRLLKLPDEVKRLVREEKLTMGHARALLAVENRQKQIDLARIAVRKELSVREIEERSRSGVEEKKKKVRIKERPDPHVADVENRLSQSLGTKVRLHQKGKKGKIEIEYYSLDELNRLIDLLL